MNKEEMLAAREEVIFKCLIQEKTIKVKNEDTVMKKGPCKRIDGTKCSAYISPAVKWKNGNCNMATHLIYEEDVQKFKNPLKASKQGSK